MKHALHQVTAGRVAAFLFVMVLLWLVVALVRRRGGRSQAHVHFIVPPAGGTTARGSGSGGWKVKAGLFAAAVLGFGAWWEKRHPAVRAVTANPAPAPSPVPTRTVVQRTVQVVHDSGGGMNGLEQLGLGVAALLVLAGIVYLVGRYFA